VSLKRRLRTRRRVIRERRLSLRCRVRLKGRANLRCRSSLRCRASLKPRASRTQNERRYARKRYLRRGELGRFDRHGPGTGTRADAGRGAGSPRRGVSQRHQDLQRRAAERIHGDQGCDVCRGGSPRPRGVRVRARSKRLPRRWNIPDL